MPTSRTCCFNGFTFWAFAFTLERRIGTPTFLALYAFGLIASDLGTWLNHRHDPGYRTLGASGAILAVLFASIVYFPSNAIYILPIRSRFRRRCSRSRTWPTATTRRARRADGVNHDAHLGGAVAGILFVALTDPGALARAWRTIIG